MATAFFRTIILYLLLIAGLRLSGKRQIGELEPIELVLTLLISDLASVPMQDFALPLFNGVIPIITLIALSTLFSAISLRNVRFRDLVCGQPALVIVDGKLRQETMRRNRLTLDELFEQLRGQGITDLSDVSTPFWRRTAGCLCCPAVPSSRSRRSSWGWTYRTTYSCPSSSSTTAGC